jgi:hypothetical protein
VLSFLGADPGYPAWFSVTADVRSRRVVAVRMTAAAHFMEARYLRWNAPIVLRPPSS